MKKITISSLLLIFMLCASCRKEADYVAPIGYPNTPEGNFEAFWNGIDQNYVFFAYDPIDWDSMYAVYRPKVNSNTSYLTLSTICGAMLSHLIDGHKELTTDFGSYGTDNEDYRNKHPQYPPAKNIQNYLSHAGTLDGTYPESKTQQQEIIAGQITNQGIYYLRLNFFGDALTQNPARRSLDTLLVNLNDSNYHGLILDLRNNGGGDAVEFYTLLSKFINKTYTWGYSQIRLQRDRYTLSPLVPESINPDGYAYLSKPIVILTDRYSFSAAEITTMAMHNLSNVTIVGDTTGGANGPLITPQDFTGDFTLPNGWTVQLAQRVTLDADKNIFEGRGIPPDLAIKQDGAAYNLGIDNVLEYAINYLSNK